MRVLFLSDFHGRLPDLDAWPADLVVAGGDYCEVDAIRQLKFEAIQQGRHPLEWPDLAGPTAARRLIDRAVAEGAAVLSALASDGRPVIAIPGNSDRVGPFGEEVLARADPRPDVPAVDGSMWNIEARVEVRDGVAFAGLGGWSGPHDPERSDRELDALAEQAPADMPLVLVSHNVPLGSQLDGVDNPELPAFVQGRMVGSKRCLAALERLRPVLCLCGHLHENFGRTERIGSTLCINGAGAYRGAAVTIDVHPDGRLGEPRLLQHADGARRVLDEAHERS